MRGETASERDPPFRQASMAALDVGISPSEHHLLLTDLFAWVEDGIGRSGGSPDEFGFILTEAGCPIVKPASRSFEQNSRQ